LLRQAYFIAHDSQKYVDEESSLRHDLSQRGNGAVVMLTGGSMELIEYNEGFAAFCNGEPFASDMGKEWCNGWIDSRELFEWRNRQNETKESMQ
jgi:hypothetical protein